jgi:acetyl esterase/lipase
MIRKISIAFSVVFISLMLGTFHYGEHERNILDLWLAKADEPTPLVIFYHGGGFYAGDKRRSMPVPLLLKLLEAGISVAGVNYRIAFNLHWILDSSRNCSIQIRSIVP